MVLLKPGGDAIAFPTPTTAIAPTVHLTLALHDTARKVKEALCAIALRPLTRAIAPDFLDGMLSLVV